MNLINKMLAVPAVVLALWAVAAQATTDEPETIAERLKPIGNVCIAGQDCAGATAATATGAGAGAAARSATVIVDQFCSTCHKPGMMDALNAPKIGDAAVWKQRSDERGGIDGLLAQSISGLNLMPPKGTCMNCSDDELRSAIKEMSGLE